MNTAEFIVATDIHMTVRYADRNPAMSDMPAGSSHWRCYLRANGRRMNAFYSMGPALSGEPQLADVLDALASAANGASGTFGDWCSDYGYDTDSRKAERTYKACRSIATRLEKLLGSEAYETLLYCVERL